VLSRDGVFLSPLNARRATPLQLCGTKAGHYGELERVHIAGASHHDESSQREALVRVQAGRPKAQKSRNCQYTPSSGARLSALNPQRAGTTNWIVEQLEQHELIDGEFAERHAFAQVAAVEKHLAAIRAPDEAMALSQHERDDSAAAGNAAAFRRRGTLASRRLSEPHSPAFTHMATSEVPTVADATARCRTRPRVLPSDGLR
jgi:hypothetical protein